LDQQTVVYGIKLFGRSAAGFIKTPGHLVGGKGKGERYITLYLMISTRYDFVAFYEIIKAGGDRVSSVFLQPSVFDLNT